MHGAFGAAQEGDFAAAQVGDGQAAVRARLLARVLPPQEELMRHLTVAQRALSITQRALSIAYRVNA